MKLYYYRDGNFGDDLNPLLWQRHLPGLLDDDDELVLVGLGTILNGHVPDAGRKLVLGAGVGYGPPPRVDDKWDFYCVRGPLTAQRLGLDPALAVTDPAILLAATDAGADGAGDVLFMPHHRSAAHADWAPVCAQAGIGYLDPLAPVEDSLGRIRGARLVIAEAMHAAIVADACRVPWVSVVCYDHILGFKWQDWCQSLDLAYRPVALPSLWTRPHRAAWRDRFKSEVKRGLRGAGIWREHWGAPLPRMSTARERDAAAGALHALAAQAPVQLSRDIDHRRALERMLERVDRLRRDLDV